ncbi:uncharacterized protein LOC134295877 isoform X1 [Anolis carolinensis]|uniref:uncharacterized protein LOC134295877 isoform X1 n=1 Tax=Anolis carolinensis TaxID=28377 RepID=UPI002F2B4FA0
MYCFSSQKVPAAQSVSDRGEMVSPLNWERKSDCKGMRGDSAYQGETLLCAPCRKRKRSWPSSTWKQGPVRTTWPTERDARIRSVAWRPRESCSKEPKEKKTLWRQVKALWDGKGGVTSSLAMRESYFLCCRRLSWPKPLGCSELFASYGCVPATSSPDFSPASVAGILRGLFRGLLETRQVECTNNLQTHQENATRPVLSFKNSRKTLW